MEKPIRRIGSRLFNVITSVISSSRSLSPSSTSSNEEIHKLPFPITSAPVVSEFPDEETAALLQTVPSKHELITFDELLQSEKQEDDPCLNCLDPCVSHANYPSYLKSDYTSPLNNTVKPYIKQVLISTGKGDWETNIEDERDSLASSFHKIINDVKSNGKESEHENTDHSRIIITNSSRQNTKSDSSFSKGNDVLMFPENILIKNVTTQQAADFYKTFLLKDDFDLDDDNFSIEKMPYRAVVVICSHRKRDKRCGVTGPLLKDEFDKVLKEKGLDSETRYNDGVGVFLSSHTGGI